MKFQLIVWGLFNFLHIRFCELQKHREHHEKNATRYCAGPAYYRMCSTDVYCSKQTSSSSTKGNHHPSFLRFWNWAEENVIFNQNLWRRRNVVKAGNPANVCKWLLGFITLGIYSAGSMLLLLLTIIVICPSIWATLSTRSLIYFWVPSSCFCIVISLSLRVKYPDSAVSASRGEAALSAPEAVVASHVLTDCFDVQPTTTSSNIITQSIIFNSIS